MRTFFLFIFSINFLFSLYAQQGFKKYYDAGGLGATFVDILWDGEKLVTTGQFLTDTASNGALNALLFMELDTNGTTLHTDLYFEPNDAIASIIGNSMERLSDGRVLVATQTVHDVAGVILNIYKDGSLVSTKKYSFPSLRSELFYIREVSDGILLTGDFENDHFDIVGFVIKTDLNGNKLWEKDFPLLGRNTGFGKPFIVDDNTIILPGGKGYWDLSGPVGGNWYKTWFIITDSLGTKKSEWESTNNIEMGVNSLNQMPNGNWLYSTSVFVPIPGPIDDWGIKPKIVCRDTSFNLVWEKNLSEHVSSTNRTGKIIPTPDGNYIAIGRWDEGIFSEIHKFAPNGDSIWTFLDDCSVGLTCDYFIGGVTVLPSGSIFGAGQLENYDANKYFGKLIKINKDGCLDTLNCWGGSLGVNEAPIVSKVKIYPNPTTDFINIDNPIGGKIKIFNIEGELVKEEDVSSNNQQVELSRLIPGVYFVKMNDSKISLTYKIIKN